MNGLVEWRRELMRIQDAHRTAIARAADSLNAARAAATPSASGGRSSAGENRWDSGHLRTQGRSVLRPAQLDLRVPPPPVETDPDDRPRSWLV